MYVIILLLSQNYGGWYVSNDFIYTGAESLGFEVVNVDYLQPLDNTELVMQLLSDIDNSDLTWYSDMNGFTMNKVGYMCMGFLWFLY